MLLFLRNILQLILSPSRGWEDISACRTPVHTLMQKGLYPFITLSALSVFAKLLYEPKASIPALIVMCFVTFVSFFCGYFFSRVIFKSMLYHYCYTEPSENKYSTVILYCVGLLALSTLIYNLMPVKLGLQYLLPLVVTLILWKANLYLGIRSDKDFSFITFGIFIVILPPLLIQSLFAWVLS